MAKTQTAYKTFSVTNTGDQPLNLAQATIIDPSGQFALVPDQDFCSNWTVNGGESCTLQVAFIPNALGAQSATLDIPSNASNGSPTAVTLDGTGTTAPSGTAGGPGTPGRAWSSGSTGRAGRSRPAGAVGPFRPARSVEDARAPGAERHPGELAHAQLVRAL